MEITDKIQDVKDTIKKIKRNIAFKKANLDREKAAALQASLAKCRGQLELSLKDFNRAIRNQVENIHDTKRSANDVAFQEQLLWDSSLGYMLVRDAISALQTVNTYDSIEYGYDLLEAATAQMNRKSTKIPSRVSSAKKTRNKYGYLTADSVKQEKIQILESIFDELKETGDIEACLEASEDKRGINTGAIDKTDPSYLDSILGKNIGSDPSEEYDINDI